MGDNNYLPIFYWIFALWNWPLKLAGLIPEVTRTTWILSNPIQTIWSKLLLVIFFFGSVNQVGKIAAQITPDSTIQPPFNDCLLPKYLFATSPIAIFSVFIFSGYDIFGLYFSLLGINAYFAKKWKWFAFWFSVAISFKYFAAIIYLPLVLIVEKRLIYLLLYGVAGLLVSLFQFFLYWHSEIFLGEIFGLVGTKTAGASIKIRPILANFAYLSMCFYLYWSKFDFRVDADGWAKRAIYGCMLSFAFLFSWVLWHPQWIILIAPYVYLSICFIPQKKFLFIIEILGYLGFVVYTMNNWAGNVDNTMLYGGVFGDFLPHTQTLVTDVIGRKWMALSRTFFYASLYVPYLIYLFNRSSARMWIDTLNIYFSKFTNLRQFEWKKILFKARFLLGCYFAIALTLSCFIPNYR